MATASIQPFYVAHKLGMSDWVSPGWFTQDQTTVDDNRFYIGGEKEKRMSKIKIQINSDLKIGKSNKLIIKITADSRATPNHMRAYLSTTNPSYTDSYATIIANSKEKSYLYLDTSKKTRATAVQQADSLKPMYAIFDKTQFKAGQWFFISLLPFSSDEDNATVDFANTWVRAKNKAAYCSATLDYEEYTKVGSPSSLKLDKTQIYKDGSITVSWSKAADGLNNPVKNYNIYCEIGKYPTLGSTSGTQKIFPADASVSSKIIYNNSENGIKASKGDKIYFSIRAIGTISNFSSDLINIGYCSVINKPPTWPTYDVTGVILALTSNSQVTISNIRPNKEPGDVDGDTLEYYYKVGVPSSKPTPTGATKISGNTAKITVTKETPTIYVWAYDGTNYGDFGERTVDINTLPQIQSINVSGENILNKSGLSCTRYLNASATLSKAVKTYKWYIWNSSASTYRLLGTNTTLNKVSIEELPFSNSKIRIKLVVTDDVGESVEREETFNIYQMPAIKKPSNLEVIAYEIDKGYANGTVNPNYINTKINAYLTMPASDPTDIPFRNMSLWVSTGGENIRIYTHSTVVEGEERYYIVTYNFEYGKAYTFRVVVTDNADRTAEFNLPTVFYRLPLVDLSQANNKVNQTEWHVLTRNNFAISTLYTDNNSTGRNSYRLEASVNNGGYITLLEFDSSSSGSAIIGETLTHTVSDGFELFKKLKVKTNEPDYKVNYRIIALNAFGVESGATYYGQIQDCTIITREFPTFANSTNFYARVGFIKGPDYITEAEYNEIPFDNETPSSQMFNPGEIIDFCLTEMATDLNSLYYDGKTESQRDTIPFYQVDYLLSSSIITPNENDTWTKLENLAKSGWLSTDEFYHCSIIAPQLSTSKKYVYFRISAIDDTEKRSSYLYCMIPLICCRKVSPKAYFSQAEVLTDANKIKTSFSITDFGGNNNRYENFFRKGVETATITLKYGNSLNALTKVENWTGKIDTIPTFLEFTPQITLSGKIYFQLSISINTNTIGGEYNSVTVALPIYIHYLESPTVSYRPHWVGINTGFRISSEVLRVEAVKDDSGIRKNTIQFVGFNSDEETLTSIDIDTGRLLGFIINGGTWDT